MPARRDEREAAAATHGRSYLVTLGLVAAGIGVFAGYASDGAASTWPTGTLLLIACTWLVGIGLVVLGLFGPADRMESWADLASRHEATVVVVLLSHPVHWLIAPFYDPRRR